MKDLHLSLSMAAVVAALSTAASAYTVSGTVADESGVAIGNADVTLVKENKATKTDAEGKFTIHEDENVEPPPTGIFASSTTPGFISINSGILSFNLAPSASTAMAASSPTATSPYAPTYGRAS